MPNHSNPQPALRRRLGLLLLVLYGTGITVGAGIYVLIGAVAGHTGIHAPWAFVLAAVVMGLTVASYAELCTRFPVAAGEAAYVKAAFQSRLLSTVAGAAMIGTAVIASATVALGASGYIAQFITMPQSLIVTTIIVGLGLVSAVGVLESVLLASLFTIIEVGGLLIVVAAAVYTGLPIGSALAPPPLDGEVWTGLGFASLLAFFAFIGFEDLTNMAEETRAPERTVPRAMMITLIVTTVLYAVVAAVAVTAVTPARLAASPAPLSLVFRELAGVSPATISAIAIVSTLNTILAEMTMGSRVIYGMANLNDLPRWLGRVHHRTSTPLIATALIAAVTLGLALTFPIERLAESTSLGTLLVFALVNLSLLRLRWREVHTDGRRLRIPIWVPVLGFLSCTVMMTAALFG